MRIPPITAVCFSKTQGSHDGILGNMSFSADHTLISSMRTLLQWRASNMPLVKYLDFRLRSL